MIRIVNPVTEAAFRAGDRISQHTRRECLGYPNTSTTQTDSSSEIIYSFIDFANAHSQANRTPHPSPSANKP